MDHVKDLTDRAGSAGGSPTFRLSFDFLEEVFAPLHVP